MLNSGSTFASFVNAVINIIDSLMALTVAVIVVVFFWRILTAWFIGGGDPKEIERGRQSAFAGLLVLVIVFGLWGIIFMIRMTFFNPN